MGKRGEAGRYRAGGAAAICAARVGTLRGPPPAADTGPRRIGADVVDRQAIPGDLI
jgi:hypothetical protein